MAEPVLNVTDIQGNILAGFNKDFMTFLFLRIRPGASELTKARHWLKNTLGPQISNTLEVLNFNRDFKAAKLAGLPLPVATWVNVAVSAPGVRRLRPAAEVDQFADEAFRLGLAKRSEFLGDPTDPEAEGNKLNWKVGGRPDNEADLVVIVASDEDTLRLAKVDSVLLTLAAGGLDLLFRQDGATLPAPWKGHEHFGFKDGVSQPGVRGRASAAATDFITARMIDPSDPRSEFFGKPGQPLIWPGEFILGQPRQQQKVIEDPPASTNFVFFPETGTTDPGDTAAVSPSWARNGSYLVIRRLRQDFGAFWGFVGAQAAELGMTPDEFGSLLVGRWQSGAPLMRSPAADNLALARDDMANNHFSYNKASTAVPLVPIPGYAGDSFPLGTADFLGTVCPHFAHIRKVNPRDGATDLGVAEETKSRAQLRRGIPYGKTLLGVTNPTPGQSAADRGLVFASYQASIVNQFETVIRRWNNTPNNPTPGGHDPIIGQEVTHGGGRRRFIDMPSGKRCFLDDEWVIPTGGGYFFAPSISAVRNTLGA
jgi:Dyp-type peroxidase family